MTRIFARLFVFALLLCSTTYGQPDTSWTSHVHLNANIDFFDLVEHSGGDYFVCGEIQTANNNWDALLVRMNVFGDTVWTRRFGETNSAQRAYSVTELENGNIVLCGYTINAFGLLLVCYTPAGDLIWSQSHLFSGPCEAHGIVPLPGGGFAVAAHRPIAGSSNTNLWLLACDADGDTLWTQNYGTAHNELCDGLVRMPDGSYAISGTTGSVSNYDMVLLRADAEGNEIEFQTYGSGNREMCFAFDRDDNGDFLLGGIRQISSQTRYGYAIKTDPLGTPYWSRDVTQDSLNEQVRGIAPLLEGAVICAGSVGTSSVASVPWMATVDMNGDVIDSWVWGNVGSGFQQIRRLSDGGYLAVGHWDRVTVNDGYVLRIVPPSGITGIVTDVETGEPVQGVQIGTTAIQQFTITDSAGYFLLNLSPGTHNIVAYGACSDRDTVFNVIVEELQTTEVNLEVGVPHLVQGQTSINIIAQNEILSTGQLIMENTGSGFLYYRTIVETQSPAGNWLFVNPEEGSIPPHSTFAAEVQVMADTTNDGSFEFFGMIYVTTNSCPDSTFSLPVIATILDAEPSPAVISDFAFYPAYPNPFNAEAQLVFDLPVETEINLSLFNIEGRLVTDMATGHYPAGRHRIFISAHDLSSGIYIAHLSAGSFVASQKLILLK